MTNTNDNKGFAEQVRQRAEQKVAEYNRILHDLEYAKAELERTKEYISQLSSFLEKEGLQPIRLKEPTGSIVGRPGNRGKGFPARKAEWQGMTLDEIGQSILNESPDQIYHAKEIASKIYDIESISDLEKVRPSLVSMLRRGAKRGLWEFIGRNRYKGKVNGVAQKRMVDI